MLRRIGGRKVWRGGGVMEMIGIDLGCGYRVGECFRFIPGCIWMRNEGLRAAGRDSRAI
jgi:hypothetical protein